MRIQQADKRATQLMKNFIDSNNKNGRLELKKKKKKNKGKEKEKFVMNKPSRAL
jgi:hypothetical protein